MHPCTGILLALAFMSIVQISTEQETAAAASSRSSSSVSAPSRPTSVPSTPVTPSRPSSTPTTPSTPVTPSRPSSTPSTPSTPKTPFVPPSTPSKVPPSSGGTKSVNTPTKPSTTYTSPAGRTFTGLSNSPTYSRGPSSVYRPVSTYPRITYNGPVQRAASGAYVPKTALTSQYPYNGARYAIPAAGGGAAAGVYVASNRPYVHMYPPGYTIIFIPYYSPVYVRTYGHWAVYNEQNVFYNFDDGDATDDFYDYDSADGLPTGCEFSNPDAEYLDGAPLNLSALVGTAPAPAPAAVDARAAAPAPGALPPGPAVAVAQAPGGGTVTQRFVSLQAIVGSTSESRAPQPESAPLAEVSGASTYTVGLHAPAPAPNAAGAQGDSVLTQSGVPAPAPGMAGAHLGTSRSLTCKPIPTRVEQT